MALPRIAGLLVALALTASARAEVSPAQAETVMRQSGLWAQMDAAAPQFRMTLESAAQVRAGGLSPELVKQLRPRIAERFTPAGLRTRVQAALARTLRAEDLPAYAAWFDSAAGRHVVALQQKAEAEAMNTDVNPELPRMTWHDASVARQNLLDEVVERSRAAEMQVTLFNEVTPAMLRLATALEQGVFHESEDDIRHRMARHTGNMPRQMHFTIRMEHALHFKDLPDDELRAWIEFLKSPAGERFTEASLQASVVVPLALLAELAKPEP